MPDVRFQPLDGLSLAAPGSRPEVAACAQLLSDLGASAGEPDVADIVLVSSDRDGPPPVVTSRQILCDVTAYGSTGPLAGLAHSEALVQARAGVADTTGDPDGPPVLTAAPFVGMETALYAAAGVLAALIHRTRGGEGQRVEVALYDVAVNALLTFLPLVFTGRPAVRAGNRHPTLAPWNAYACADGWALICGPTDDQWRRLTGAIDRPELARDPRFATPSLRFEAVAAVDAEIGRWTSVRPLAEVIARIGGAGIPCGPILTLDRVPADANIRHRASVLQTATGLRPRLPIRAAGAVAAPAAFRAAAGPGPLAGIRIVEIGMNTVAPLACRQLGAMGADVVKIEPPRGDSNRINAPLRADGEAFVFALSNTDKRGVVLDLSRPEDAARAWAMIETADVVIENLKPGSLAKLGFGAEAIQARRGVVHCSVNGFGNDSAYPGRPALDTVVQAMSGAMTPTDGGMPVKAGISVSDQLGGQFGLVAILAGLLGRLRQGRAARFDIAMQDCTHWATAPLWSGTPAKARVLACTDGWIAAEGAAATSGLTVTEALALCDQQRIPAAQVLSVAEVLAHPNTLARGLVKTVPTPDGSSWQVLETPIRMSTTPATVRAAMPRLGWPDPGLAAEFAAQKAPA